MEWLAGLSTVAGGPLLHALRASYRWTVLRRAIGDAYLRDGRPGVGAFWHRHIVIGGAYFARFRTSVMVSRSRDGEIASRMLARTRIRTVRGSSSRGGKEALRELTEHLRAGGRIGFPVDGPTGPPGVVKVGCVLSARDAAAEVVPIGAAARPCVRLRSWDRTVIPCPGARVVLAWGEPIPVPPDASREEVDAIRQRVQDRIHALEEECERRVTRAP